MTSVELRKECGGSPSIPAPTPAFSFPSSVAPAKALAFEGLDAFSHFVHCGASESPESRPGKKVGKLIAVRVPGYDEPTIRSLNSAVFQLQSVFASVNDASADFTKYVLALSSYADPSRWNKALAVPAHASELIGARVDGATLGNAS